MRISPLLDADKMPDIARQTLVAFVSRVKIIAKLRDIKVWESLDIVSKECHLGRSKDYKACKNKEQA